MPSEPRRIDDVAFEVHERTEPAAASQRRAGMQQIKVRRSSAPAMERVIVKRFFDQRPIDDLN